MGMMLAASALTAASTQLPGNIEEEVKIVVPELSNLHSVHHSFGVLGTSTSANRMLGLTSPS